MSFAASPGKPLPNYRTTRLLGIFNIVFASCLLIFGLCMTVSVMIQPMIINAMNETQKKFQEKGETTRRAQLEANEKATAAATTDAEKDALATERKEIEARPKAQMPGMVDMAKLMDQPMLQGWTMVEILTGLGLNIAMFISGIGLLKYKGWARNLAIWSALLKILRLVFLYGFFIVMVVPPMSQRIGEMVGQMMVAQQANQVKVPGPMPDAVLLTKVYTITYSVMGAGMIMVGSIYPAVMLWFFTRPRVKAACEGSLKPVAGRDEL